MSIRSPSQILIYGAGYLNRIALKLNDEADSIRGKISIRTSNNNIVTFSVFQNKLTGNGKENPAFKSMQTVMNEYKDSTMVGSFTDADVVEIKDSGFKFPNAKLYGSIKYDGEKITESIMKSVNFITRKVTLEKFRIVFKIYGLHVVSVKNGIIKGEIIDYNKIAHKITLSCNDDKIKDKDILNVVGVINEGLRDGLPICEYQIVKFSETNEYKKEDFDLARENYKKTIEELAQDCPF